MRHIVVYPKSMAHHRYIIGLVAILTGCGSNALSVEPGSLNWGEVDFEEVKPDEGYDQKSITLTNDGSKSLDISVLNFDDVRLILGAQLETPDPPVLRVIEPGSNAVITVAVWGYDIESGELTEEVTGSFYLDAKSLKDPVEVQWAFTPIRGGEIDTGR